jgi:ribosomal protein S27E
MPLTVPCLKCKRKFQVSSKLAGTPVRCAACGHVMTLPTLHRIKERRRLKAERRAAALVPKEDLVPLELAEDEEPLELELATDSADYTALEEEPPIASRPNTVACPHCQGLLFYESQLADKRVACPHCSQELLMPRL